MAKDYINLGFDNFLRKDSPDINAEIVLPDINQGIAEKSITVDKLDDDAIIQLRNVDEEFVAGETIAIRDAVGLVGEITETTDTILADQATHVKEDDAASNFNGQALNISDSAQDDHALVSFDSMPAIPSGTGLTILTIKVEVYLWEEAASDRANPTVHPNSATFTEASVVWNDKPAVTASIGALPAGTNAGAYVSTGQVTIDSTQYGNIKDNGVTFKDEVGSAYVDAEYSDNAGNDTANKPKIDVEFSYKIGDNKVYQINASTGADAGQDYTPSFVGIALEDGTEGNKIQIRSRGKVPGFSSLTERVPYYLADTDGDIQDSAGTNSKIVGRSTSDTELEVNYDITT